MARKSRCCKKKTIAHSVLLLHHKLPYTTGSTQQVLQRLQIPTMAPHKKTSKTSPFLGSGQRLATTTTKPKLPPRAIWSLTEGKPKLITTTESQHRTTVRPEQSISSRIRALQRSRRLRLDKLPAEVQQRIHLYACTSVDHTSAYSPHNRPDLYYEAAKSLIKVSKTVQANTAEAVRITCDEFDWEWLKIRIAAWDCRLALEYGMPLPDTERKLRDLGVGWESVAAELTDM